MLRWGALAPGLVAPLGETLRVFLEQAQRGD